MGIINSCWLKASKSWGENSALVSKCVLVVSFEPGCNWEQIKHLEYRIKFFPLPEAGAGRGGGGLKEESSDFLQS